MKILNASLETQFLNLSISGQTDWEQLQLVQGSVGMLAVLIYILMLENIFRGKEEHSLVLIMNRIRKK